VLPNAQKVALSRARETAPRTVMAEAPPVGVGMTRGAGPWAIRFV